MSNFGGRQTVTTSVRNFARTTLRKRGFATSMPPRFPVPTATHSAGVYAGNPRAGSFFGATSDIIGFLAGLGETVLSVISDVCEHFGRDWGTHEAAEVRRLPRPASGEASNA